MPKWIEIVDEFVGILRLLRLFRVIGIYWCGLFLVYVHCIDIISRWDLQKNKIKKTIKKKLNERIKNKTFKRTKSWKLITVNCEWNIVTQKKIVIFVKTKMRNLAATAMTFYMTKKATCIGCLTLTFLFQVKLPSLFTKSSQEIPAGSCDIVISSAC